MNKRRFPQNDKLVVLTRRSYEALHALCVELHYLSCGSGIGRPSQPGKPPLPVANCCTARTPRRPCAAGTGPRACSGTGT